MVFRNISFPMNNTLIEIDREISHLAESSEYRREQKVWAEESQLKNMRRMATKARSLLPKDALDLIRVVSDSASLTSKILILAEKLFEETKRGSQSRNPSQ